MASMNLSCMVLMVMVLSLISSSDLAKDIDECSPQLVGLTTCLPYVGGKSKAPTPDCCTGLKQAIGKEMKCLCVLVKDRDDPELGLQINATLALGLPSVCKAFANVSQCPSLLHLAPNSPDAKVFEDFANNSNATVNSTIPRITGTNVKHTSDGSCTRKKRWLVTEMVVVVSVWCLVSSVLGIHV
ncbi:hypothetical protein GIB67_010460 [Kingdonia uniflora]|uniref:Bifunctional inhibitor/plant lipid transfer protein/seed storage helical domain-containing protein n=1 Tax=Kingdonia uniflora TaxID=39325 RepID=A0A7J7MAF9_9MAGN|nr:hypothetical protein GIB67_010460 [Kingdonia uniflora]